MKLRSSVSELGVRSSICREMWFEAYGNALNPEQDRAYIMVCEKLGDLQCSFYIYRRLIKPNPLPFPALSHVADLAGVLPEGQVESVTVAGSRILRSKPPKKRETSACCTADWHWVQRSMPTEQ